ncbi:ATP-grasp domain-containing protein [Candidatus Saccharibacteria bacterium]|nr:ATP-grasp domain-containing protein [Candidatus Saccharibacteria bacterium]
MKKIQKHIEIVRSSNKGLSSLSQESCDAIYSLLKRHYCIVGVSIVNNLNDLRNLVSKQPDLVFMGMKYLPSGIADCAAEDKKIWLSTYLEQRDIAHTGSAGEAICLESNKPLAKQRALDAGFTTAPYIVIKRTETGLVAESSLSYPLFVKPSRGGGGDGINDESVVHNLMQLDGKVNSHTINFSGDWLIEQYLPGREFSVGILKEEYSKRLIAMPLELVTETNHRGERILSQEVKSMNLEKTLPVMDVSVRESVVNMAVGVFKCLGARDYGRIDIRFDEWGNPHFLEANLIPSLIEDYGSFPKACVVNLGMDYEKMILSIVRLGLERAKPTLEVSENSTVSSIFIPPIEAVPA